MVDDKAKGRRTPSTITTLVLGSPLFAFALVWVCEEVEKKDVAAFLALDVTNLDDGRRNDFDNIIINII